MGLACCSLTKEDSPQENQEVVLKPERLDDDEVGGDTSPGPMPGLECSAASMATTAAFPGRNYMLEEKSRIRILEEKSRTLSGLSGMLSGKAEAVRLWRKQALAVIGPGAADLCAGLGTALSSLYDQRYQFTEAVLAFMFEDKIPDGLAATPKVSDGADSASPSPISPSLPSRAVSWPSWSTEGPYRGPRSVRLQQRAGKALQVKDGSEALPATAIAEITNEVMGFGDAEVLITRQTGSTASITEVTATSSPSSSWSGKSGGANIQNFCLNAQVATVPWLFRSLVDGFMDGPLTRLVGKGLSGQEALEGLAEAWPSAAAFFHTVVKVPEVCLQAKPAMKGCLQVDFSAPVDLKAMMAQYPSVAKLLRILRSTRVRFTNVAMPLKPPGNLTSSEKSGVRQVAWLTFEDGELFFHFLLHGKHIAWLDMDENPIVEGGEVAVLPEPVPAPGSEESKEMTIFWCVDNLRLRLSDFGCIGLSSLALPQMTLKVDITTAPLGKPPDDLNGGEPEKKDPYRRNLIADIVFRIVDMGAYPAETLVRPLFDVKLMRSLLVQTFVMSWSLRPASKGGGEWQLLHGTRVSFPKVAKAFRSCFRVFAQKQVKESDWLGLFANLFFAMADDLRGLEGEAAAAKK